MIMWEHFIWRLQINTPSSNKIKIFSLSTKKKPCTNPVHCVRGIVICTSFFFIWLIFFFFGWSRLHTSIVYASAGIITCASRINWCAKMTFLLYFRRANIFLMHVERAGKKWTKITRVALVCMSYELSYHHKKPTVFITIFQCMNALNLRSNYSFSKIATQRKYKNCPTSFTHISSRKLSRKNINLLLKNTSNCTRYSQNLQVL